MISKKQFITLAIVFVIGVWGYLYVTQDDDNQEFIIAQRGNLIQEVSVTGIIDPAQSVELAFTKGGVVAHVFFNIGDKVQADQIVVRLDNTELQAQLTQANAKIENANAKSSQYLAAHDIERVKLDEMQLGTRKEEINIKQAKVDQAEQILQDANTTFTNTKQKTLVDLEQDYDNTFTAVQKSVNVAMNTLITITNIQNIYFTSLDQKSTRLVSAKANAILLFLGEENAGRLDNEQITQLNGGAKKLVVQAQTSPTYENIDIATLAMQNTLQAIQTSLDAISIATSFTAIEISNIATAKINIAGEIISLFEKKNTILVQKSTNQDNITTAQTKINNAKNALFITQSELILAQAGFTIQQIDAQKAKLTQANANILSQKAQIKEARANAQNISAQLQKTIIRTPFAGIITKQDAKIGEIIPANINIVSLMSEKEFEIKAYVAETDITKINVGDNARVTLDAYGGQNIFETKITMIDPAATIIEGIATYEIKLQFINIHEIVKSGMTANIDIESDKRVNIIIIPQRVVKRNGGNIGTVTILENGVISQREITFGLIGSDGNIEIINGISEGEKVIINF